jgi:hypothetical protein
MLFFLPSAENKNEYYKLFLNSFNLLLTKIKDGESNKNEQLEKL